MKSDIEFALERALHTQPNSNYSQDSIFGGRPEQMSQGANVRTSSLLDRLIGRSTPDVNSGPNYLFGGRLVGLSTINDTNVGPGKSVGGGEAMAPREKARTESSKRACGFGASCIGEFESDRIAVSGAASGIASQEDPGRSVKRDLHGSHSTNERYTSFVIQRKNGAYAHTRATITGRLFSGSPSGAIALVTGPGRFDVKRQSVNSADRKLLGSAKLAQGYFLKYEFDQDKNYLGYEIVPFGLS